MSATIKQPSMDFMDLPIVMIENVLSYLSYDEIAKNRIVSQSFNEICMKMLNRGFLLIEKRHMHALKNVKAQLPRRESERRHHNMSRHCDILTSIETRISMLNMTYSKFIDHGLCCFIPGKVIDEIKRVLVIVETENNPPRAHEVLQELRDISSMAIEHFDDKVAPAFRKRLQERSQPPPRAPQAVCTPLAVRQDVARLRFRTSLTSKLCLFLAAQEKVNHKRLILYRKMAMRQHSAITAMAKRQTEQEATIAELKKRIEECDIKYSEITHTNQAAGGKANAERAKTSDVQPLRHFSTQIKLDLSDLPIGTSRRTMNKMLPNMKPRKPVIKLPSLSEPDEPPAKVPKLDPPSTSHPPRPRALSTMAKIRGITNELKAMTYITKSYSGKLKRSMSSEDVLQWERKKLKKD